MVSGSLLHHRLSSLSWSSQGSRSSSPLHSTAPLNSSEGFTTGVGGDGVGGCSMPPHGSSHAADKVGRTGDGREGTVENLMYNRRHMSIPFQTSGSPVAAFPVDRSIHTKGPFEHIFFFKFLRTAHQSIGSIYLFHLFSRCFLLPQSSGWLKPSVSTSQCVSKSPARRIVESSDPINPDTISSQDLLSLPSPVIVPERFQMI